MVTKISITKGIIRAARFGRYPGGPLALGIILKVPNVDRVYMDDETITVGRRGEPDEEYVVHEDLEGWVQLFNIGEGVPAGILRLGTLRRRGGPQRAAWFEEYEGNLPSTSFLGVQSYADSAACGRTWEVPGFCEGSSSKGVTGIKKRQP